MNKYPYTVGHFMIIPHLHIDNIENLDPTLWLHMSTLVQKGVKLLKEDYGAQGVNIGMNLGTAAGAGISPHIHYHLVPRYQGDTNFITTIGDNRVYSTDFVKIYESIKALATKHF
jgi:diadenosine tetraphosphate (Ap4A) HIT family hydrolase